MHGGWLETPQPRLTLDVQARSRMIREGRKSGSKGPDAKAATSRRTPKSGQAFLNRSFVGILIQSSQGASTKRGDSRRFDSLETGGESLVGSPAFAYSRDGRKK